MTEIRLKNEAATIAYAHKLAATLKPGQVIALSGELGAGKSVFARSLMRSLGVKDEALPSPTFAIIQEYKGDECKVAHMDWYRLEDANEIEMLGVRDFFQPPWISIIEWPEHNSSILPADSIRITITVDSNNLERRTLAII
ncbi:MAG: tRNA (adenosine(37)-N6)-threonylcarbamoyltransferase complex ATPase subunit type 1 TsaE [Mariprofundaceae bacterium]